VGGRLAVTDWANFGICLDRVMMRRQTVAGVRFAKDRLLDAPRAKPGLSLTGSGPARPQDLKTADLKGAERGAE